MTNNTRNIVIAGIEYAGPDGKQYETTGEWRPLKGGDWFLGSDDQVYQASYTCQHNRIILRELPPPAKPRRVPTDQDALHRPKCWVRYNESDDWRDGPETLIAVVPGSGRPFKTVDARGSVDGYPFCEIEDVVCKPTIEEIAAKFRREVLPHIGDLVDDSSNQFEGYVFAYIMAHDGWDWSNARDADFLSMFSSR